MVVGSVSKEKSNLVRGWAILAVVLIHVLAYFPGIFDKSNYQWVMVALDQTARFCVPAFLIISGYGLSMKYDDEDVPWWKFVVDRSKKLLPSYLLWSMAAMLLMWMVPEWVYYNRPESIWTQLFFGQADYQMYFMPLILQFYILFPLIWRGRKKINLWLMAALVIQLLAYSWFGKTEGSSERFEYVISLSWIFYFVLGIWLAKIKLKVKFEIPLLVLCVLVWGWVISGSVGGINRGINPLLALKFTRIPAMVYGTIATLTLMYFGKQKDFGGFGKWIGWLGEKSYLIFLAHTMGLRLIYGVVVGVPSLPILGVALIVWLLIIFVSVKITG